MKTFKILSLAFLFLLTLNCSSDDDNNDDGQQLSMIELLNTGRWYQESKTPGSFTACEKKTYLEFSNETEVALNIFVDDSGPCESEGVINATFTLSNNNLTINSSQGTITATIDAISMDEMTLTTSDETIVFDKTEG